MLIQNNPTHRFIARVTGPLCGPLNDEFTHPTSGTAAAAERSHARAARPRDKQPTTGPGFLRARGWLGREDSNLRIRGPNSRPLPLGHAPPPPPHGAAAAGARTDTPSTRTPTARARRDPASYRYGHQSSGGLTDSVGYPGTHVCRAHVSSGLGRRKP